MICIKCELTLKVHPTSLHRRNILPPEGFCEYCEGPLVNEVSILAYAFQQAMRTILIDHMKSVTAEVQKQNAEIQASVKQAADAIGSLRGIIEQNVATGVQQGMESASRSFRKRYAADTTSTTEAFRLCADIAEAAATPDQAAAVLRTTEALIRMGK